MDSNEKDPNLKPPPDIAQKSSQNKRIRSIALVASVLGLGVTGLLVFRPALMEAFTRLSTNIESKKLDESTAAVGTGSDPALTEEELKTFRPSEVPVVRNPSSGAASGGSVAPAGSGVAKLPSGAAVPALPGNATSQKSAEIAAKPAAPECLSVTLALKNAKRNPNLSQHRVILDLPEDLKDALKEPKSWCLTYGAKRLEARPKPGTQEWRVSLDPDLAADWNDDSSLQLHVCKGNQCEASCPKELIQYAELDAQGAPADADSKEKELIAQWSALENEAHPPAQWKVSRSPAGSVVSAAEGCGAGHSIANR